MEKGVGQMWKSVGKVRGRYGKSLEKGAMYYVYITIDTVPACPLPPNDSRKLAV